MYPSIVEPHIEADDIMGCYISAGKAIGVTIDKDLRTVPGYHWNPDKEKKVVRVSEEGADLFLYQQWMQGDSTDGIPGLWMIGPKKAQKFIRSVLDEGKDVISSIIDQYCMEERPEELGIEPKEYALAMARCVRILRDGEYDFNTQEINLWNPIVGYSDREEIE
jgi:DNA polymerase-1